MSLQKGPPPRPDPGVMYLRTIDSHDHLKFHLLMIDRAKKKFLFGGIGGCQDFPQVPATFPASESRRQGLFSARCQAVCGLCVRY